MSRLPAGILCMWIVLAAGCASFIPDLRPGSEINTSSLERAVAQNHDNVHAHFLLGRADLENGTPKTALVHFRRAMEIEADYEEAWQGAGVALLTLADYRGALAHYTRMNSRFTDNVAAREGLASSYYGLGDLVRAESHAREALELNPNSPQAIRILGDAAYAAGDYRTAIEQWERALELDGSLNRQLRPILEDLREYVAKYGE